jgi:Na+/H+-dicarboxylate symporter
MMYCTFAVLFIAQAYGIELPIATQITMLLILMLTSKGMAGVPRASLVVIAATLNHFNIPEAGLLLILGVDTFLDMGRSATNAVGNSIASAVVAKWEGALLNENETTAHLASIDSEAAQPAHAIPESEAA